MVLTHGGPDAFGTARWDFSTNANACGPEPSALRAVTQADATRYPDPAYARLRDTLGRFHGVPAQRIVVGASASELIARMTCAVARTCPQARVFAPNPGYGDYRHAAAVHGLPLTQDPGRAGLVWHTVPGSPLGDLPLRPATRPDAVVVVDCAYMPLCLEGTVPPLPPGAWQVWSPNKALGLTGVRGAYAVAPAEGELLQALIALTPSWPVGAHGVALLGAWTQPAAQHWLHDSLETLREWKRQQLAHCHALGWQCTASATPFFVARWDGLNEDFDTWLPAMRAHGVKLRDTASMGLPGWVRLSVQSPDAQHALVDAWRAVAEGVTA
jgi:histidinol-phosphate aminotransferase